MQLRRIDPIEQGTRDALLVFGNDSRRTRTGFLCITQWPQPQGQGFIAATNWKLAES
jgi:hypothetical protein